MIAVIIAGIALAIILGWVLSIQTPSSIARVEVSPESVSVTGFGANQEARTTVSFVVRAYDGKGNPVVGTAVSLQGAGVSVARLDEADGADGAVAFPDLEVRIPAGQLTSRIVVTVEAPGHPSVTDDILVVRG